MSITCLTNVVVVLAVGQVYRSVCVKLLTATGPASRFSVKAISCLTVLLEKENMALHFLGQPMQDTLYTIHFPH